MDARIRERAEASGAASPRRAAVLMLALSLVGLAEALYVARASYTGETM